MKFFNRIQSLLIGIASLVHVATSLSILAPQDALDMARQIWTFETTGYYEFQYTKYDMMSHQAEYPWTVHVRSYVAEEAYTASGSTVPVTNVQTIDDLFNMIQSAIDTNAHLIDVTYSETHGYPVAISIDYDFDIADDEVYLDVLSFIEVPSYDPVGTQYALDQSRNLWDLYYVTSYSYNYDEYCMSCLNFPWAVQANQGKVRAIDALGNDVSGSHPLSIPEMFDIIQSALDLQASEIQVNYHPQLGFPQSIYIDYNPQITDNAISVAVWGMTVFGNPHAQLILAQDLWYMNGLSDYSYQFQEFNMASEMSAYPWTVEVKNYQIVSIADDNQNLVTASSLTSIPSIENMFAAIEDAIVTRNANDVRVTYDSFLGFPQDIYIDYDASVVDEELSVLISDFTML